MVWERCGMVVIQPETNSGLTFRRLDKSRNMLGWTSDFNVSFGLFWPPAFINPSSCFPVRKIDDASMWKPSYPQCVMNHGRPPSVVM